jgi:hypothetical protein
MGSIWMAYGKNTVGLWFCTGEGRVTEVYGWDTGDIPTKQNDSPSTQVSYRSVRVEYGKYDRLQVENW